MNAITNIKPLLPIVVQNEEPRILDTDLAERLGFKQPRDIRKIISRHVDELRAYGICDAVAQNTGKRGRPAYSYYLREEQALLICILSDAPNAVAVRKEVIDVFMAFRRGQLELSPKGRAELPNFGDPVAAARAWADVFEDKRKAEEAKRKAELRVVAVEGKLIEAAPKVELALHVEKNRRPFTEVIRQFEGVSITSARADLIRAGVFWKAGNTTRVKAKYRDSHFTEKFNEYGFCGIFVEPKGYELLAKFYRDGRLTMRKNARVIDELLAR